LTAGFSYRGRRSMKDLSYFSLGFRSDYVYNQLSSIKPGAEVRTALIKEALQIINDFLEVGGKCTGISCFINSEKHNASTLAPLLWELYPGLETDEIIENLKKVLTIVHLLSATKKQSSTENNQDANVEYAIDFFSSLSNVCLSKSVSATSFKSFNIH
jgi:hypothetical protein